MIRSLLTLLALSVFLEGAPFVTVDLRYELGNQLFQAAAAIAVARDCGYETYFPDVQRISFWGMPDNWKYVLWRLNPEEPPEEEAFFYQDTGGPIPHKPNMRLAGLFQSEKHFAHHKEEIKRLFAPSEEVLAYLHEKYEAILTHPCTVGLHVRTFIKDYGRLPTADEVHHFTGVEYYEKAVAYFPKEALFVVCSDEIGWCKENLSHLAPNMVFIEGNSHCIDFYLLSLCHHIIISNSTFSWWAAYLNPHEDKKVITVDHWTGKWWNSDHILLPEWIRVSRGSR